MRKEKHVEDLIGLLKDIRKEPSAATLAFAYSTASIHMFQITFHGEIDPSLAVKHGDFRSKGGIERLKLLIKEFSKKQELFEEWRMMENKRNELCYGYPSKEDVKEYAGRFYIIKEILESVSDVKFNIAFLEKYIKKGEQNE